MARIIKQFIAKSWQSALWVSLLVMVFIAIPASAANTDKFMITTFDIDMKLGRDDQKRSTLQVTEKIVANFLVKNQNHGLERAFVKKYDNHPTDFQLKSVTDETGKSYDYHWSGDTLRIGDKDEYVYGEKTYVISYSQRDVTKHYDDTENDEFYWDVLGLDWRVPVVKSNVQIAVDDSIKNKLQPEAYCYRGANKSKTRCQVNEVTEGKFSITADSFSAGEGMTVALGFKPDTFAAYQQSAADKFLAVWSIVQSITATLALPILAGIGVWMYRKNRRSGEIGTIIPEYLPPKDISVAMAANVWNSPQSTATAQLLDFAVRHFIVIREVKEKSLWKAAEYEIEILKNIDTLKPEEKEVLTDMFDHEPKVGDRLNLKKLQNNWSYSKRTHDDDKNIKQLSKDVYGLREEDAAIKKRLRKISLVSFIIAIFTLSLPLLALAAIVFGLSWAAERLTDKGLQLFIYLKGLKKYIKVAETERLKMLQSPEGAKKIAEINDANSEAKRVVLYERALPYAVLFGEEKDWAKQLGEYYEKTNQQPEWYSSNSGVFSAAAFTSSMSGLSTATQASSSSSSSGGSSGGGSAGGGGGGGGGGGW